MILTVLKNDKKELRFLFMSVHTTGIWAKSPAIENWSQSFHLEWSRAHSWPRFSISRVWDKCSTETSLFQKWFHQTPVEEWVKEKKIWKKKIKNTLSSHFYCGQPEFYPTGDLKESEKYTPVLSQKWVRKLGCLSTSSLSDRLKTASKSNCPTLLDYSLSGPDGQQGIPLGVESQTWAMINLQPVEANTEQNRSGHQQLYNSATEIHLLA